MTSQKEQLSYLLKSDKDLEELIKSIPKIVPFKREKGLRDFTDLLENFIDGDVHNKFKVLFIDEAQELSLLQ